ncbi:DUF6243 family protein [Streptomyces sp. NPDC012935]|uniref:DUF6243 family protein n=1 Tax=Streptomyces sp. NPDC012935 TaxID=3364857 RepID=UPI0036858EB4
MARGGGNMLGVGGTRRNLDRNALRGGARGGRIGAVDADAQKRELLRKFQERNAEHEDGTEVSQESQGSEKSQESQGPERSQEPQESEEDGRTS